MELQPAMIEPRMFIPVIDRILVCAVLILCMAVALSFCDDSAAAIEVKLDTQGNTTCIVTSDRAGTNGLFQFEFSTNLVTWHPCYNFGADANGLIWTQTTITNARWFCRLKQIR